MSKDVLILDKSTSLQDAAEHMKKLSVGCVIVTDSNIPVRIITKRDFMTKIAAEGRHYLRKLKK